jgi:hypothetical protein
MPGHPDICPRGTPPRTDRTYTFRYVRDVRVSFPTSSARSNPMTAPVRIDLASLSPDELARLSDALRVAPGQRSWSTRARLCERDDLIRVAARSHFWPNATAADFARAFRHDLARYHTGAWRRDRCCKACPAKYVGTRMQILWHVLRAIESVLSERRLRHIVGRELPPFDGQRHDAR